MENIIYQSFNIQKEIFLFTADVIILSAFLVQALITDIQKNKIKNSFILTGWLQGALLSVASGKAERLLAVPVIILILWPLFAAGVTGAGDIKLLSVAGIFLGLPAAAFISAAAAVSSAFSGIFIILFRVLIKKEKYIFGRSVIPLSPFIFSGFVIYVSVNFLCFFHLF